MNIIKEKQLEQSQMKQDVGYNEEHKTVFKTNEYSLFSPMGGNRNINKLHLQRLGKSMKEQYLIIPIIVNEDFQIIDGQHRFYNAMDLGLPVYYIINEGYALPEVQRLNTNMSNWKAEDYMIGYSDLGNINYIKYREYREKFKFGHPELRGMLSGDFSSMNNILFKTGKFEVTNEDEFLAYARRFNDIQPYYKNCKNRSFVQAMLALFRNPLFKFDTFMNKLKFQNMKLVDCATRKDYLMLLEDIYNFRSNTPVLLRYSK